MECSIKWVDGVQFLAETGSGHAIVIDGAPDVGGRNTGPRPMETVLAGTGACTASDVVVILKRSGQDVTGCEVELTAERAETDPKVFTKIHFHFIVTGRGLKPEQVERAVHLSAAGGRPGNLRRENRQARGAHRVGRKRGGDRTEGACLESGTRCANFA